MSVSISFSVSEDGYCALSTSSADAWGEPSSDDGYASDFHCQSLPRYAGLSFDVSETGMCSIVILPANTIVLAKQTNAKLPFLNAESAEVNETTTKAEALEGKKKKKKAKSKPKPAFPASTTAAATSSRTRRSSNESTSARGRPVSSRNRSGSQRKVGNDNSSTSGPQNVTEAKVQHAASSRSSMTMRCAPAPPLVNVPSPSDPILTLPARLLAGLALM